MQKQAPTLGRIMAMVLFALSCFGILIYLWVSFGGPTPLRAEGYRFQVQMPESALLVNEAPVRMAGLDVGHVKTKELRKNGGQLVEIEMDRDFAPIPEDSRVTLRQKSLLGQIYIEITPGSKQADELADGGRLAPARVQETVDFDELISTFDKPTRDNYQGWIKELARAIKNDRGEDLNDAFANFVAFTEDGNSVLEILDEQDPALRRLIKNTGVTLGAINRRYGEFGEFVTNANDFFGALASRNDALAETIRIFPTFLEESRLTFDRLKTFAQDTRPLVRELQPVALQLRPTLRDLGTLAPDLEHLFRSLEPVIDESGRTLPEAEKFLRCLNGSRPCDRDPQGNEQPGVLEALYPYLEELNPVLAYLNYYQAQVGAFFTNGVGSLYGKLAPLNPEEEGPRHYLRQFGITNARGLGVQTSRQVWERGNAYPSPNFYNRFRPLGAVEAWNCENTGAPGNGEVEDPITSPPNNTAPPCFVQPPQLWGGTQYPRVTKGDDRLREPPQGNEGTAEAVPKADGKP
jgi:phospholipid/cholesterol/gamma-HCH transport system substrate-binding protein